MNTILFVGEHPKTYDVRWHTHEHWEFVYCTSGKGAFRFENGKVVTDSNNHGGILGGISSGMPIEFRVAIKPTPSIAKEQRSVDLASGENCTLQVRGRHDPCIVPRAVPCVEAAAAVAVFDAYLVNKTLQI